MDENQFYREVTMRICGSLEIDKALWNCLLYVKDIIPAEELIMTVYDPEAGTLDVVATATDRGGILRSDKVTMPLHLQRQLEEPAKFPRVRISNDVYSDEIMGRVAQRYQWPDSSIIVARLIVEDKFVGSFIVRANGTGRYKKEDADIWSLINEPAAIALPTAKDTLSL